MGAMSGLPKFMGAVEVEIQFTLPVPKSWSKQKHKECLAGNVHHTKRPDIDNMAKSVLDALNGVAYPDDSQVVCLRIRKGYGEKGETTIAIREFSLGDQ